MRFVITGASDGLGFEVAKLCLGKGHEVVNLSRKKPDLNCTHIETDLADEKSLQNAITEVKKLDSFDVLINCAGVLDIVPIEKLDPAITENLLKVNVLAPMVLTAGLIEEIKKNNADVVNVASTIGHKAYESQLAYGTSKWAMRGISKNLQVELKKNRVISFCPGGFKSKLFEKAAGKKVELGDNWMEPSELAKLMLQLLELPKNMEVSEIIINRK